ncbi:hypothetical protein [Streptomyces sp. SID3212]|uniref:hypothetical protein n=1 Tax=Streptomyces sp. SID3212 TaxID=2690259 RepID=UPI00136A1C75|nr:hypothetical protein [Streptomyces sp. SID3212]MYV58048.1 hypothetical protein [Streptomyces sp. SID3212]
MTAVATNAITAAQWNAQIRDNFAETEAAKAVGAAAYLVATGSNALTSRTLRTGENMVSESTSSTSYADLGTPGPAVTVTTGTQAIVFIAGEAQNNTDNSVHKFSVAVSGATTTAASDDWAVIIDGNYSVSPVRRASAHRFTLTGGSNTFTMKYAVGSGIGTFGKRQIAVLPF